MKAFKARTQSGNTGNVTDPRTVKWVQVDIDGFRLTIDGSTELKQKVLIQIDDGEVLYTLTDSLLLMLLRLSDEYMSQFIEFSAEKKDGKH